MAQPSASSASGKRFEVASVKPAGKIAQQMISAGRFQSRMDNVRFEQSNIPLLTLICMAYNVDWNRVSGPMWMSDAFVEVIATLPPGASKEDIPEMLRELLKERFKLSVHHESKNESVYLLTVSSKGLKLKAVATSSDGLTKPCAGRSGQYSCRATTLRELALNFSIKAPTVRMAATPGRESDERKIDLPVVDQTGRDENFEIDLQWIPPNGIMKRPVSDDARFPPRDPTVKADSIFGAFEAVGLVLRPGRYAFDVIVVDHVEREPVAN